MATFRAQRPWNQNTLEVSMIVVEMANKFHKKVQVELYAPARLCPVCKHKSGVFVRPTNQCAPCWSYRAISKITNGNGHGNGNGNGHGKLTPTSQG
jgi:hypothetical protein